MGYMMLSYGQTVDSDNEDELQEGGEIFAFFRVEPGRSGELLLRIPTPVYDEVTALPHRAACIVGSRVAVAGGTHNYVMIRWQEINDDGTGEEQTQEVTDNVLPISNGVISDVFVDSSLGLSLPTVTCGDESHHILSSSASKPGYESSFPKVKLCYEEKATLAGGGLLFRWGSDDGMQVADVLSFHSRNLTAELRSRGELADDEDVVALVAPHMLDSSNVGKVGCRDYGASVFVQVARVEADSGRRVRVRMGYSRQVYELCCEADYS